MQNKKYAVNLDDQTIRYTELDRLRKQGDLFTSRVERVPSSFDRPRGRFIDLACGAGEWALKMAREFPQAESIIGVDIFPEAVAYANEEARLQGLEVEFYKGDIFNLTSFEDNTFDLVNARFLAGILPANEEQWIAFVRECYRICKPGGMVQLTESNLSSMRKAPAYHRMIDLQMLVLAQLGKTFAETELAITPMLKMFVEEAGFVQAQYHAYAIDYSAGTPAHKVVAEDALVVSTLLKPIMVRGIVSEEEFNQVYEQMEEELNDPKFRGLWPIVRVTARKRV